MNAKHDNPVNTRAVALPGALDSNDFYDLVVTEIDAVFRMALHLSRCSDLASDLSQETFARALAARKSFRLGAHGVRPWLFKILYNAYYSHLMRQRRKPGSLDDAAEPATGPAAEPANRLNSSTSLLDFDWDGVDERIVASVNALPLPYRSVLLMWAIEGLRYRDIADVLGVPLGTVMSRLHRARTILSAQLAHLAGEYRLPCSMN